MARILVVDDDPSVRALLRDVLELEGHDVQVARDGVVLDVVMPGLDGHEVLAQLRAMPDGQALAVVMLTAAADDANAWRGWSGGVDYFLGKPFDADDLLRCLDHLLVRRAVTVR